MWFRLFYSLILTGSLAAGSLNAQESQTVAVANPPVAIQRQKSPQPRCYPPIQENCPPLSPLCEPCDYVIDYHNPIVFNGFDLSVEWLIWKVQQKSSTFVLSPNGIHQPFPPSTTADSIGNYHSASFDWSSGVRAAIAYTFERDAWNLLGQYTFYSTRGSDKISRPSDPTLYLEPTNRDVSASSDGVEEMKSSTDFLYQVTDALLCRRFLPGCQIIFNFFTGATGAWIQEKWKVVGTDMANANPNVTTVTKNRWSFGGGGIRAGLAADWHLGKGFSLFNKGSIATLVGSYENSRKTFLIISPPQGFTTLTPNIRNSSEEETWVVPSSQLELGINWKHRFCSWSMMLQAGFEVNTWYDLHQFHQDPQTLTGPNNDRLDYRNASPVSLWGANIKANFSF